MWAGCFLGGLGAAQGQPATLPFTETFEGGDPLPGYWAKSVTSQGEVLLTFQQTPHTGGVHALFDDTVNDFDYSRCRLTLTVDLLEYSGVVLKFWAKEFGDEPHAPNCELGSENGESTEGSLSGWNEF